MSGGGGVMRAGKPSLVGQLGASGSGTPGPRSSGAGPSSGSARAPPAASSSSGFFASPGGGAAPAPSMQGTAAGADGGSFFSAASASSTAASSGEPDYFATPARGGPAETPGAHLGAAGGDGLDAPHPWASLLPKGMPQTPGGVTPLMPATPQHDGGATPTLRFPSLGGGGAAPSLSISGGRSFSGASARGSVSLPSASTSASASASAPSDISRYTPLDCQALARLLGGNGRRNGSEGDIGSAPRLRRASRSSSPGAHAAAASAASRGDSGTTGSSGSAAGDPEVERDATLVLDIRPSTSFGAARIAQSINVCAPSTLLRRAGMTVERIEEEMLGSAADIRRFSRWRRNARGDPPVGSEKENTQDGANGDRNGTDRRERRGSSPPLRRIVVLDTDTRGVGDAGRPNVGGGGACLLGLLRKFDAAGFAGELCWLVGGFNGFAKTADTAGGAGVAAARLIDRSPLSSAQPTSAAPGAAASPAVAALQRSDSKGSRRASAPGPMRLPSSAPDGDVGPLSAGPGARKGSLVQPRGLPAEAFTAHSLASAWTAGGKASSRDSNARDSSAQSQGSNGPPPSAQAVSRDGACPANFQLTVSQCANPFFDNIRQNRELAHGVTEVVPLDVPEMNGHQRSMLPAFLARLAAMEPQARAKELAQSFFDIERAEQDRLMHTMRQHAAESSIDPRSAPSVNQAGGAGSPSAPQLASEHSAVRGGEDGPFPFSIAAALERGAENRYNNIWTYEHSRVRIGAPAAGTTDYLNASFVEPARVHGSKRRYIATQAPLPSTFEAFWTTVWEQNVAVVAMLTREHEAGRVQSHMYWGDATYGKHLSLRLVSEETLDGEGRPMHCDAAAQRGARKADAEEQQAGGNFFSSMDSGDGATASPKETASMVRRELELTSTAGGGRQTRRVVQLQYIAWPDYHIPDSPRSLLAYMDLAAAAQLDAARRSPDASADDAVGPMLVHCSAGVGRTGTYVVIDAVLDVLRRQRVSALGEPVPHTWDNACAARALAAGDAPRGRSTTTEDVRMSDVPDSPAPTGLRSPRRNLKRELSPSAMDLDSPSLGENGGTGSSFGASSNASGSIRDMSSPPPMRRSRSELDVDPPGTPSEWAERRASPAFTPRSARTPGRGSGDGSGSSGAETPSRAMGSLHIARDSPGLPASSSSATPTVAVRPRALRLTPASPSPSTPAAAQPSAAGLPLSPSGTPAPAPASDALDYIRAAVEVTREQRMSSVQTTRQYVFTYAAVLAGLLRDDEAAATA
jgi:protein tyrosine phosphatase